MSIVVLILALAIASISGWIYGEAADKRPIRVASSVAAVVLSAVVAYAVSSLHTALSIGMPVSTAVHDYLDASAEQLTAGHTDFVVKEFSGFKERAHVTYESGAFVDAVIRETARMKAGPKTQ